MVLRGGPGLGKSRLAARLAEDLAAEGVVVRRIVASAAGAQMPLAPFAALAADATGAAAVNAVLGALGVERGRPRPGPGDPLLVVDDLNLLDDASVVVLQQLIATGSIRVLATMRSQVPLSASVTAVLGGLDALGRPVEVVEVAPLADPDILDAVAGALGCPLDAPSARLLTEIAHGNPLYAREVIVAAEAAGTLREEGGVIRLSGEVQATALLEELILARLDGLAGAEREVMEMLAMGGRLPLAMLLGTAGEAALERLERVGLVTTMLGSTGTTWWVDAAHPLQRELLRARLGPVARMRVCRALAQSAAHTPPPSISPANWNLQRRAWEVRGGVEVPEDDLLAAAAHAVLAGDSGLGAELAGSAFRASGSARAALTSSWCLIERGEHDAGIAVLRQAHERTLDPWERAAIRLNVAEAYWWSGRVVAGADELHGSSDPPGPWHDLCAAQEGVFAMLSGDLDRATRHCAAYADHAHIWVRAVAAVGSALAAVYGDRIDEAVPTCQRVLDDAATSTTALLGDPSQLLAIQLIGLLLEGEVIAAQAFADQALADSAFQPSVQRRAWSTMIAGQVSAHAGRLERAIRELTEARQSWAACHVPGFAAWCGAGAARALVEVGRLSEAEAELAVVDELPLDGFGLNEFLVDLAHAWVAHGRGDRVEAVRRCVAAVERSTAGAQWTNVAIAWHDVARLGLLDEVGAAVDIDRWPPPRARLAAARSGLVRGLVDGDWMSVATAAEAFAEMGCAVYAAEAAALGGVVARRRGATAEAARLTARGTSQLAALGRILPPESTGARRRPGSNGLSARELEIARMAAAGMTNRMIAERLVVSERTVENHLYRASTKLGVGGRRQLAEALSATD